MKVYCDQCEALVINGVPCHETGCPNRKLHWTPNLETDRIEPDPDFVPYTDTLGTDFDLMNEINE